MKGEITASISSEGYNYTKKFNDVFLYRGRNERERL